MSDPFFCPGFFAKKRTAAWENGQLLSHSTGGGSPKLHPRAGYEHLRDIVKTLCASVRNTGKCPEGLHRAAELLESGFREMGLVTADAGSHPPRTAMKISIITSSYMATFVRM
ncbi:MAG: hypothetical protein ACOYM3_11965 [Terrimicrobiaceae bacterium]